MFCTISFLLLVLVDPTSPCLRPIVPICSQSNPKLRVLVFVDHCEPSVTLGGPKLVQCRKALPKGLICTLSLAQAAKEGAK